MRISRQKFLGSALAFSVLPKLSLGISSAAAKLDSAIDITPAVVKAIQFILTFQRTDGSIRGDPTVSEWLANALLKLGYDLAGVRTSGASLEEYIALRSRGFASEDLTMLTRSWSQAKSQAQPATEVFRLLLLNQLLSSDVSIEIEDKLYKIIGYLRTIGDQFINWRAFSLIYLNRPETRGISDSLWDDLAEDLLAWRNSDDGWPEEKGGSSNSDSTAIALVGLSYGWDVGPTPEGNFGTKTLRAGGGYGFNESAPNANVSSTAWWSLFNGLEEASWKFFLTHQTPDGAVVDEPGQRLESQLLPHTLFLLAAANQGF